MDIVGIDVSVEPSGSPDKAKFDAALLLGERVSVVNAPRIKAYGESELARNKADKLDAGLIARFWRVHVPPAWVPAAAHPRELRELFRRCDALKSARVQELNSQTSGFAPPAAVSHGLVRRTQ